MDASPIPGPSTWTRWHNFVAFRRRPAEFLLDLAEEHGLFARFGLGPVNALLVAEPALVEQILLTRAGDYGHAQGREDMKQLLGEGLLTSAGQDWKRARKLLSPPLRKKQIDAYATVMVDRTHELLDTWPDGASRNVSDDMMTLALRIVVDTLFGVDTPPEARRVGHLIDSGMHYFEQRIRGVLRFLPRWWPSRYRKQFFADRAALDAIVFGMIEARRQSPEGDDLLSRLLQARYEDGSPMSAQELRDQVITMFLAGHETTALALSYALHQVADAPDVQARVHEEVDAVLGARRATADDLGALPYCRAVFNETLRLCPPAWAATRRVVRDTELAGHPLKKGTVVFFSPFVTHRQAQFFEEPRAFRPERWLDGLEQRLPRFAYVPFGGGPRICIGNHFALLEGALVLATLFQRRHYDPPHQPLFFEPSVTLRPAAPIHLGSRSR